MTVGAQGTSADTTVDVLLGVGVLLLFAGVVARAFASRVARRRVASASRERDQLSAAASAPARHTPTVGTNALATEQHEPLPQPVEPPLSRRYAGSLDSLARVLDRGRRLTAAEDRVATALAGLADESWLVERGVILDERRIPFLAIGPSGLFLICASDGAWTLGDLHVLSQLGADIRRRLPGQAGEAHAAVCLAFDELPPRAWYGGEQLHGRGGWVLGVSWLLPWITGFAPADGLGIDAIRRLDEAAGPVWERRSAARLPARPNLG